MRGRVVEVLARSSRERWAVGRLWTREVTPRGPRGFRDTTTSARSPRPDVNMLNCITKYTSIIIYLVNYRDGYDIPSIIDVWGYDREFCSYSSSSPTSITKKTHRCVGL